MSSSTAAPVSAEPAMTTTPPSPTSPSTSSQVRLDLQMDLCMLRQLRAQDAPIKSGSSAFETVAAELPAPRKFGLVSKKAVRDRVLKCMEQHTKKENWAKRQ